MQMKHVSAPVCSPLILFPFFPLTILICCLTLGICIKLDHKGLASHMQGIKAGKRTVRCTGLDFPLGLARSALPSTTPYSNCSFSQQVPFRSLIKAEQQAASLFGLIICHVAAEDANNHSCSLRKNTTQNPYL